MKRPLPRLRTKNANEDARPRAVADNWIVRRHGHSERSTERDQTKRPRDMRQHVADDHRVGRRQQIAQRRGNTAQRCPADGLVQDHRAGDRRQSAPSNQRQTGVELNAHETSAGRSQRREHDAVATAEVREHIARTEGQTLGQATPLRASKTPKGARATEQVRRREGGRLETRNRQAAELNGSQRRKRRSQASQASSATRGQS